MRDLFPSRSSGTLAHDEAVVEVCRNLVESTRDIILLVREDGSIALANAAAERAYGKSREQLCTLSIEDLRAPGTRDEIPVQLEAALETGILFETEHVRSDGTPFPVEVSSRAVVIGGERYALSIIREIGLRRRREREREALMAELEAANRRLDALFRIVSGVVGRVDTRTLVNEALAVLREVLDADAAILFKFTGDGWELLEQVGYPHEAIGGFWMPSGSGFASVIADAGEAVWIADVTRSSAYVEAHDEFGVKSMLGAPLYIDGRLYGVLECTWSTEREPDETERLLLQVAADRVTAAIAAAAAYEGARRSRDIEKALFEAATTLASSHVLGEMMPEALGVIASALGCDAAAFGTYVDGGFEVRYSVGVPAGTIAIPDHTERISRSVTSPPVVVLGPGAHDPSWLQDAWGWAEAIITPVRVRGEWVGALLFGRRRQQGGFDEGAKEALRRFSTVVSLAYANTLDFEAEHLIAETLQEALLTMETPVAGVRIGHRYRSSTLAARVGGDFYDVFTAHDGLIGAFVGDVSGKGLDAAVFTTVVKPTLRAFAHESVSPADVVARTNAVLAGSSRLRDFATVLYAVIDPRTGTVRYCRAGHPAGIVVRADGAIERTEQGSPVVGALPGIEFDEGRIELGRGDLLVLITDGVTEARDAEGSFFGEERLLAVVSECAGASPEEVVEAIDQAVLRFTGGRLSDDVALVCLGLS